MNLSDAVLPVTDLKTRSSELIRQARETGRPIVITQNGRATAVLQDVETWQRQQDAMRMLQLVAQGAKQLDEGRGLPHEEVARDLERLFDAIEAG